jgi:hypothetical protein
MDNDDSKDPIPVTDKISPDLNRIANVLEARQNFVKEIDKLAGSLFRIVFVLALVVVAKTMILKWKTLPEGTHCVVAQDDVYGIAELNIRPEIASALKLKDEIGVQNLVADGKALPLPRETECLVLDSTEQFDHLANMLDFSYYRKVRVLSGAYYGKVVWVPNPVLHIAARTDAGGGTTRDEKLEAFIAAKRNFSSLNPDYKESMLGAYDEGSVTKLSDGQYRVLLKYDSKLIQCEVDQSVAHCSQ